MHAINILLVEDNEGDIILFKEEFDGAKILTNLSIVRDGNEAINFLTKKANYKFVTSPDMVLLDINLPKKNGYEVLKFIKNEESLKLIPVIMFITFCSEIDINLCIKK